MGVLAQVWKRWRDLRHSSASEPISRRRSPANNLTCAITCVHLRHVLRAQALGTTIFSTMGNHFYQKEPPSLPPWETTISIRDHQRSQPTPNTVPPIVGTCGIDIGASARLFGAGVLGCWRRCGEREGTGATGKLESPIRGAGPPPKNTPAPLDAFTRTIFYSI